MGGIDDRSSLLAELLKQGFPIARAPGAVYVGKWFIEYAHLRLRGHGAGRRQSRAFAHRELIDASSCQFGEIECIEYGIDRVGTRGGGDRSELLMHVQVRPKPFVLGNPEEGQRRLGGGCVRGFDMPGIQFLKANKQVE